MNAVDALPDGWRGVRLGDVARLGGGTTPARSDTSYWDGGAIPWATPSDITSLPTGVSDVTSTESAVTERALADCSLPLNPPGTVLMTSRATIGFVAINTVPMTTNQGFITFTAGRDLDTAFLLQWLIAQRPNLVAAAGGSTFKELSRRTAKLLPINLPPLDEQRRIAEVLRSVDEMIAANAALLDGIKAVKQATMDAAMSGSWRQMMLGDALDKSEGGGTPSRDVESYWNGDIPWASVKDVVKGEGSTPEETITSAGLVNSTSKLIPAGTNIFVARMSVGAVVRYPFAVAINQDLMALTPSTTLDPNYLFYWLQARKDAFVAVATGTTVKGIRKDVLLSFPIPLPPLNEQRRIAEALRSVDGSHRSAVEQLTIMQQMKTNLMADLLSGRVRVPA